MLYYMNESKAQRQQTNKIYNVTRRPALMANHPLLVTYQAKVNSGQDNVTITYMMNFVI